MFALEPTEVIEDEPWRIDARCADGTSALVDLFFSEQLDDILRAKAFCVECPVTKTVCKTHWSTRCAVSDPARVALRTDR